jgi:hypothetical protein
MKKLRKQQLLFRKLRFYNQNKPQVDTLAISEYDWRDREIRAFIERAREDIGYSDKTAPCDIYSALIKLTPHWEENRRKRWDKIRSLSLQNKVK